VAAEDWIEDGYDDSYWDDSCAAGTLRKTCQFCGQEDLHWEQASRDHKWRLHDHTGRVHRCGNIDDFHKEALTGRKPVGLFNRKPIYVTDRGDEFDIEDMKASHLLNALNHHKTQINTVDWLIDQYAETTTNISNLHYRRISLHNTVEALAKELLTRDPAEDHEDLL
jgi:hypothetical protein